MGKGGGWIENSTISFKIHHILLCTKLPGFLKTLTSRAKRGVDIHVKSRDTSLVTLFRALGREQDTEEWNKTTVRVLLSGRTKKQNQSSVLLICGQSFAYSKTGNQRGAGDKYKMFPAGLCVKISLLLVALFGETLETVREEVRQWGHSF